MQLAKLFILCMLIFFELTSLSPTKASEHVKWMSLEEAQMDLQKEKRPVLIDLYTDWCGWCRVMDKKTYSNANVAAYLQNKFYSVRVNAETKDNILWNNKLYRYNRGFQANDFAVYLTKGKLSFPTTIIIPSDGSEPQAIAGYLETKEFEMIVKYFGEGNFNKISFDDYVKQFKPVW